MASPLFNLGDIAKALSSPGPQTDHSTHTTHELPGHPLHQVDVGTNQTSPDGGDFSQLRAGKNGPKPY